MKSHRDRLLWFFSAAISGAFIILIGAPMPAAAQILAAAPFTVPQWTYLRIRLDDTLTSK